MSASASAPHPSGTLRAQAAHTWKQRWLSRRALLFHLEVAVVAPACAVAGWWQATRALAGNTLSWVYSVEWPIFSLLAIAGWWHLIHEDPAELAARKARSEERGATSSPPGSEAVASLPGAGVAVAGTGSVSAAGGLASALGDTVLVVRLLAIAAVVEVALGFVVLAQLPSGRPAGFLPRDHAALYLVHAIVGACLVVGSVLLVLTLRGARRSAQMLAWMGLIGMALAGLGGILTVDRSLVRFLGIALMMIGPILALLGYLVPALGGSPPASTGSDA